MAMVTLFHKLSPWQMEEKCEVDHNCSVFPDRTFKLTGLAVERLFILIFFFCMATPAQSGEVVSVGEGEINLTSFPVAYFADNSGQMSFGEVKEQVFVPSSNKLSLGTEPKAVWSRIELANEGDEPRRLFLHHPYVYHSKLAGFYLEGSGDLIGKEILDLDHASDSPLMYRGSAVYEFELPAGSERTLYVQTVSYSHQWFTLLLVDQEHSRRMLIGTHNDIALLIGVLVALIFYNFLLYFASSNKENIFYSLYLVSGAVWISLSYGLLANVFNVYGAGIFKLHLSLITMPIFLTLFMMAILGTKESYPREHRLLQVMLGILTIEFIYGLFDIHGALKPASTMAALMMFVTMGVTISLVRKGNLLAKFFLIGHSFFLLFNGIAVLFYKGIIGFTYVSSHGVGIGITLEALMLAFIIAYRIKILEGIKDSHVELKQQAVTDPLTTLYNRRYFFAEAKDIVALAKKHGTAVSVLAVDVDHFKSVNDKHGHQIGDELLVNLADTLKYHCRATDLIARFGGEEFVCLLPGCDLNEAAEVAESLREAVDRQTVILDTSVPLRFTISIGVSSVNTTNGDIREALSLADRALYQAKNSGRNQVRTIENCEISGKTLKPAS